MKKSFIALCCAAVCTACSQQTLDQKLDAYFDTLDGHFMGSVVVQRDGQTIYQKSLGFADVENQIPCTTETEFRIGSISKPFTAVMVLKAANEGRLSLNDPLTKYFSDAQIANAEQITIDQLLYHRSGLRDIVNDMPADYLTYYTTPQTRQQILERVAAAGTNFAPDSTYRYCNTGYNLLGFILEDVYGKPYAEVVDELIVKPLDLRHTRFSEAVNPQRGDARSYALLDHWQVQPETDASVALGAGAMASTPADLAKFGRALFDGIFGDNLREQMKQQKEGIGRGLFPFSHNGHSGYGHSGAIDGFKSQLEVFDNLTIAFCSNGTDIDLNKITLTILDILDGKEIEKPDSNKYLELTPDQLAPCEGIFVCEAIGMEVTVTVAGNRLCAQAAGQQSFPLDALSADDFEYKAIGVAITFSPDRNKVTLKQMGQTFEFVRKSANTDNKVEAQSVMLTSEQLSALVGTYSSAQLGMDLKITSDGTKLQGQATGQAAFPLTATSETDFEFKPAGIVIKFDVSSKKLTLNQGGGKFDFVKKE